MSKTLDSDFRARMKAAAAHAKAPFTPQSLGTFLGVDRRKAAVWMDGSLPRADRLFAIADRFGVDPRWFATGHGNMLAALATEDQIVAAADVNMVVARISGMKPGKLKPVDDQRMRDILRASPEGWPPRPPVKK
jgi:hypothetical protein